MDNDPLKALLKALKKTGIPISYHHFEAGNAQKPPYICYVETETTYFFADGIPYYTQKGISVGLYTQKKDLKTEAILDKALADAGISLKKEYFYIEEEKIYETIYMGVIDIAK